MAPGRGTPSTATTSMAQPPKRPAAQLQLLEINVISAQDLAPLSRRMRTYAVAWIHQHHKLSTRVDSRGGVDPAWNDKFVFRVDDSFLRSNTSSVNVDIYALRCLFPDVHVGTVRVLLSSIIPKGWQPSSKAGPTSFPARAIALQVRRPSGRPQGILNVAVAVLDATMRSMPLYTHNDSSALGYRDLMSHPPHHRQHDHDHPAPKLRRSKSEHQSEAGDDNHSTKPAPTTVNGSDLGSDLGPAPSTVAANKAAEFFPLGENGSSVLGDWASEETKTEGLMSKLERWRMELPPISDMGFGSFRSTSKGVKRKRKRKGKSESGGGLLSCFGDSYGCECSIMCGVHPRDKTVSVGGIHVDSSSHANILSSYK